MGDTNEPTDLKGYVMQCKDAAELHEIAKEKFGEVIHNRTGLDKSRERVLELIDGQATAPTGETDSGPVPDQATAGSGEADTAPTPGPLTATSETASSAGEGNVAPNAGEPEPRTGGVEMVTIPRAEYEGLLLKAGERDRPARGGPGSKLKNVRTGREFPWTAALAKNKNMVEV